MGNGEGCVELMEGSGMGGSVGTGLVMVTKSQVMMTDEISNVGN